MKRLLIGKIMVVSLFVLSCSSEHNVKDKEQQIISKEVRFKENDSKFETNWTLTSLEYSISKSANSEKGKKRLLKYVVFKDDSLQFIFNSKYDLLYNNMLVGSWKVLDDRNINFDPKELGVDCPIPLGNEFEYIFPVVNGMQLRTPLFDKEGEIVMYVIFNFAKASN